MLSPTKEEAENNATEDQAPTIRAKKTPNALLVVLSLIPCLLEMQGSILRDLKPIPDQVVSKATTKVVPKKDPSPWCGQRIQNLSMPHIYEKAQDPAMPPLATQAIFSECENSASKSFSAWPEVGELFLINSTNIYCNPDIQAGGRLPPVLAFDLRRQGYIGPDGDPITKLDYTLITPSHMVVDTLQTTAPGICKFTTGTWEWIHILDESWDGSLQYLVNWLTGGDNTTYPSNSTASLFSSHPCLSNPGLIRFRIIVQEAGIHETSSDNTAFSVADANVPATAAPIWIEVQSDHLMTEHGWNRRMVRPFLEYGDLISVSGRCGHGNNGGKGPKVGRCGGNVGSLNSRMEQEMRDSILITPTSNRGPLAFPADAIKHFGYFDELMTYFAHDDHDLHRRAMWEGLHTGYSYVRFYAPLEWGASRRQNVVPPHIKARFDKYLEWRTDLAKKNACRPARTPRAPKGFDKRTPDGIFPKRSLPPIVAAVNDTDFWMLPLPPLPPLKLSPPA